LIRWSIVFLVCACAAHGQRPRDEWKHHDRAIDLYGAHTYSLAGAPRAEAERSLIYHTIAGKIDQAFPTDTETNEEREAILSARARRVKLANGGSQQIIVQGQGPYFCGVTGNCDLWVFTRANGKLRLLLEAGGNLSS
jgi:hypothetical protein